jgi:hypothetical protein
MSLAMCNADAFAVVTEAVGQADHAGHQSLDGLHGRPDLAAARAAVVPGHHRVAMRRQILGCTSS